ncbi:hypothetical protein SKAU_G00158720, partial [Synaphobranchus kaupii]
LAWRGSGSSLLGYRKALVWCFGENAFLRPWNWQRDRETSQLRSERPCRCTTSKIPYQALLTSTPVTPCILNPPLTRLLASHSDRLAPPA